jgi:hypothetical protein
MRDHPVAVEEQRAYEPRDPQRHDIAARPHAACQQRRQHRRGERAECRQRHHRREPGHAERAQRQHGIERMLRVREVAAVGRLDDVDAEPLARRIDGGGGVLGPPSSAMFENPDLRQHRALVRAHHRAAVHQRQRGEQHHGEHHDMTRERHRREASKERQTGPLAAGGGHAVIRRRRRALWRLGVGHEQAHPPPSADPASR